MDIVAALRTFLRVAETGSFSAAAVDLGLTQPAVSRQVSALEAHLNTRLLHRTTSASEIARLTPLYSKFFTCCIDLDRSALNTLGNALETRRWTREHGFNSLIVVTSNWHMPRALVELERTMPDIMLVPYPVALRPQGATWWTGVGTGRLLFAEYVKFVAVYLGVRSWPAVTSEAGLPR